MGQFSLAHLEKQIACLTISIISMCIVWRRQDHPYDGYYPQANLQRKANQIEIYRLFALPLILYMYVCI